MKHRHSHPHPHKPQADLSHFWVITPISNPVRFKRRYELYWDFAEMCQDAGVNLITVEQAFGHRPFMVTNADNDHHVQVRSHEELWLKENMCNLGFKRAQELDPLCREVAWIDADCFPMVPAIEWFEETWHALQHYEFVQMWERFVDLGPKNEPLHTLTSFMAGYEMNSRTVPPEHLNNLPQNGDCYPYGGGQGTNRFGSPGLAWAANLSAINAVGGLLDKCIVGSGDWHMAHCLVGALMQWNWEFKTLSKYSQYLFEWQLRCERWIKRDVGHVPITLGHWWHGNKNQRGYGWRGKIIIDNKYDPHTDVKYDAYGVLQLETWTPRQIRLRDELRMYFKSRNEDSIDVLPAPRKT